MADRPRPSLLLGSLFAAAATIYAFGGSGEAGARQKVQGRVGWAGILANVWNELDRDHVSVMAAGVAFYSFLSIFPAMSALISTYGLIADPSFIEQQVGALSGVLPQSALQLIAEQLHALVAAPRAKLGISLTVSLLLALWSAMSSTGTLMQALTVAYEETDQRSILGFYAQSAALTVATAGFGLLSLVLIAVVPAALELLPFPAAWADQLALARWPVLAALVLVALACLYRFATGWQTPRWHWLAPGTVAAAALWLAGSAGFSFYVARFASYDKTYGSLGAVVVLLMWLYVSAYIILAGAELNSEYERARSR